MEKLDVLSNVLERQHDFIRRTDAKLVLTLPIATIMLGSFSAALAQRGNFDSFHLALYFMTSVSLLFVFIFSFFAINPHVLSSVKEGKIFAGHISTIELKDYVEAWNDYDSDALIDDFASQIHVNASIAMKKFRSVSRSLTCLTFAIPLCLAIVIFICVP